MTATDELRRMLGERGIDVDASDNDNAVYWFCGRAEYEQYFDGSTRLIVYDAMPEQAIAATVPPDAASTYAALLQESAARMALQRDYNNQCERIRNQRKNLREMQAALERRTCHDLGDERVFHCSECGFGLSDVYLSDEDYLLDDEGEEMEPWPPFCPNCGRRVVG